MRRLPPETAHGLTLAALKTAGAAGLAGRRRPAADPILATRCLGRDFASPIGLAAGFDKNAEAALPLLGLGFGFVEVGSVTPRPQPGNPRPRLFRLPRHQALINRLGFNNQGLERVAARLARLPADRPGPVGANIGRNRDADDPLADYVAGVTRLAGLADYLVINVSSPNTEGLRRMQAADHLAPLLAAVTAARAATGHRPALLLKIAPDLAPDDLDAIVEAAVAHGLDGLVVTNTTVARPACLPPHLAAEAGGLSGRPLMAPSTAVLRRVAAVARGRLVLIGVGGIASGADAYAKIRAGATLVQLYTALVYQGPRLIDRIAEDLARRLRQDGFSTLGEAVGADL